MSWHTAWRGSSGRRLLVRSSNQKRSVCSLPPCRLCRSFMSSADVAFSPPVHNACAGCEIFCLALELSEERLYGGPLSCVTLKFHRRLPRFVVVAWDVLRCLVGGFRSSCWAGVSMSTGSTYPLVCRVGMSSLGSEVFLSSLCGRPSPLSWGRSGSLRRVLFGEVLVAPGCVPVAGRNSWLSLVEERHVRVSPL